MLSRAAGSQVNQVQLAGESYKMFVQPLRLPVPIRPLTEDRSARGDAETTWFVAGFMPVSQFRALTMEISPNIVVGAIGLIVLGLLIMPLLKVR